MEERATVAWRLNRLPQREADALSRAQSPIPNPQSRNSGIVDAHPAIATLGIHSRAFPAAQHWRERLPSHVTMKVHDRE